MACFDRETATAYLRGDLEPDEAEHWASHVAGCEACRQLVEEVSALIDDVRQDLMALDVGLEAQSQNLQRLLDRAAPEPPVSSSTGWLKPATLGLAFASLIALVISLWALWDRGTPLSAAEILQRATAAEQTTQQNRHDVSFRVLTIEERHGPARTLASRRRVEAWKKAGSTKAARRTYDDSGHLLAGEWTDDRGTRTLYTAGRPPVRTDRAPLPARSLLLDGSVWQLDLSATSFTSLIGSTGSARASETPTTIQVSYDSSSADSLTAATLTLSKSDLHAIEETAQIGRGEDAREYRIAEDRFSHMPDDGVQAKVFEVDEALAPSPSMVSGVVPPPKRLSESVVY
jgi:hypothetical protein